MKVAPPRPDNSSCTPACTEGYAGKTGKWEPASPPFPLEEVEEHVNAILDDELSDEEKERYETSMWFHGIPWLHSACAEVRELRAQVSFHRRVEDFFGGGRVDIMQIEIERLRKKLKEALDG